MNLKYISINNEIITSTAVSEAKMHGDKMPIEHHI